MSPIKMHPHLMSAPTPPPPPPDDEIPPPPPDDGDSDNKRRRPWMKTSSFRELAARAASAQQQQADHRHHRPGRRRLRLLRTSVPPPPPPLRGERWTRKTRNEWMLAMRCGDRAELVLRANAFFRRFGDNARENAERTERRLTKRSADLPVDNFTGTETCRKRWVGHTSAWKDDGNEEMSPDDRRKARRSDGQYYGIQRRQRVRA